MITKIALRQKPISGNRQTLYLDFYPAILHPETGRETRRQFLNLYLNNEIEIEDQRYLDANGKEQKRLVPVLDKKGEPKKIKLNHADKQHNSETLKLAEQIRQNWDRQLNGNQALNSLEKRLLEKDNKDREQAERSFLDYYKQLADKRKSSNYDNWISAYKYLEIFANGNLKFADINERFCENFKEYLLSTKSNKSNKVNLSQNSVVSYFNKFKATLKQAYKDGLLSYDLNSKIKQVPLEETRRNFLTIEELNKLIHTECQSPLIKQAALFSALTGLRFSDVQKLVWSELEFIKGNGYFIKFTQKKTKGVEMMPISDQAYRLLGMRKELNENVFEGLEYSAFQNKHLYQWLGAAGITKDITFHCFRHTFATLQLSLGTDIYTVSKLLGHRELKTTQIYTKVIDPVKRAAVDKIQLDYSMDKKI